MNYRFLILAFLFISLITIITSCDFPFPEQDKVGIPDDHDRKQGIAFHKGGLDDAEDCSDCHGFDLKGDFTEVEGEYRQTPSCYQCHGKKWDEEDENDDD